jgi:sugar phosphate permease
MLHYAWIIAFTGTLVTILAHGFGRMSYSVILPSMREGLALNYKQVGLIATGNFIGYLVLGLFGGFLAARFGIRRVVFISLLVIGISLFLTGLSNSFIFAFFTRLVTGAANGSAYIPIMALPAAWFAVRKRGLATGIVSGGIGLGLFLSGIILPSVIAWNGWRYSWFCMGIVVFILAFVCLSFLRDNPAQKGLQMYGGREESKTGPKVTLFSAWRDVVREPEIWKLAWVYFMYGFAYIIYITFFIAYLCKECNLTPSKAGGIFALLGALSIFCGVIWGGISDVLGRRYGAVLAYITLALAFTIFALWKEDVGFYLSAVIFGITAWSIPTIMAAAVGDAVGGKLAPAGLGFVTLSHSIGQALGPAIGGWIKDASGTFTSAFLLSAIVAVLGALVSLILKKKTAPAAVAGEPARAGKGA